MTDHNVSSLLEELSRIFPKQLNQEQIDNLIDRSIDGDYEDAEFQDVLSLRPIYTEPTIMNARNNSHCNETLINTHGIIKSMMIESNFLSSDSNWDSISQQGFSVERYLIFIYSLLRLYDVDSNDKINRDLAINAGRTYISLLALPGAKRCQVWDSDLIIRYFKLFEILEKHVGDHRMEILFLQMLDECRSVFNIVCLNEHDDVKNKYIDAMALLIKYVLVNGKSLTSYDICMKAYKNLECLCFRPLPDKDIENTMYLIFCRTFELHYLLPRRNNIYPTTTQAKHGITISSFFVYLMDMSSDKMRNVLLKFIKSMLSNPEHNFKKEDFLRLLDIAVRYELAIYWKLNDNSILEYLQKLSLASDVRQRSNGTEFCGRMLLLDSTPESTQSVISLIPREVEVIKILLEKVQDKQDSIVLKALNGLKSAFQNGNEYTKKIFNIVFNKQMPVDNPEILNMLQEEAEIFQRNLMIILQTSESPYIKKSCISLLEMLALNNVKLVEDDLFIATIMNLTDDSSYLVKTQTIEMVNNLTKRFPKQQKLLVLWLEVILCLLKDDDNKIVENATKSLTDVFKKIESYENTDTDDKILPWIIIRLIMAKGKRNVLLKAFNSMSSNFLTQDKLRQIETHIFTSNRTEAWCLLSLIAGKMKSNNPDIVIDSFIECIEQNTSDSNNLHLILEVIKEWMKYFNSNSILTIATKSSEMLKRGECQIGIIQHLYEICLMARMQHEMDNVKTNFPTRLNEISLKFLLDNFENFRNNSSNEKFLSYMLIYCESNTDLPNKCNQKLLDLCIDYLRDAVRGKISFSIQHDVPRKLNILITVLTRFAIRDNEIASIISPELGMLLRKNLNISVIKNIMLCLNDLCKKHTATVEPVFKEIVYKLQSPSDEIRSFALEVIFELVMQDYIKLKGRVLLNLLVCTVDKNEDVALKAISSILSYTNDKNPNLLYSCFLESVYIYNNFVQTDDFGVFPANELDVNFKALYGPDKLEQRQELYQFFVQNINEMNEIHLMLLLKNINLMLEKLQKKQFKKQENGVYTFNDLLYIFKLICNKREDSKQKIEKCEDVTAAEEYDNELGLDLPHTSNKKTAEPRNSRKNKNLPTIKDAVTVLEKMIVVYSQFVNLMTEYDKSLVPALNELSLAIARHFGSLIEYAKPVAFWKGLRKKLDTKSTPKRRKTQVGNSSDHQPSTSSKKKMYSKQLTFESSSDDEDDIM
ncbi:unnamed protein product [Diamesa serratosioi]